MTLKNNFKTELVHKSFIKNGDVIIFNGQEKTVSNKDIKRGFTGITIFGDPLPFNNGMVERFKTNTSGCLIPKNMEA